MSLPFKVHMVANAKNNKDIENEGACISFYEIRNIRMLRNILESTFASYYILNLPLFS